MADSKSYGTVDNIAEGEPGSATGSLAIAAVLASSIHDVASVIVVGSPTTSPIDLAQLAMTSEQAFRLGSLIMSAAQDALEANRRVERLRMYGPAAARLCFALAEADLHDVLVDQSRIRLGYPREAQTIAEAEYERVAHDGDWRKSWRTAGEALRKETDHAR